MMYIVHRWPVRVPAVNGRSQGDCSARMRAIPSTPFRGSVARRMGLSTAKLHIPGTGLCRRDHQYDVLERLNFRVARDPARARSDTSPNRTLTFGQPA